MFRLQECGKMAPPSVFSRISHYSEWILEATCALTDDNTSQLCPDMVCPPSESVLGYPWAKVPDASGGIKTFHGYTPKRVVQSPLAGTPFNATTTVLVLAVDEADSMAMCAWTLVFPELTDLGETYEDLPKGTYERTSSFPSDVIYDGLAIYMTVQLGQSLDGDATVAVRAGYNETLTLTSSDSYGELWFERQYNPRDLNDTNITIVVSDAKVQNYISVFLYGQVKHYEFVKPELVDG
jgi:hypothetical protein